MSRRGFTIKPCPGCGSTNERPQNKVCAECEKLILLGKDYLKVQDDLKNKEYIPACISEYSKSFHLKRIGWHGFGGILEHLGELLHELALLISMPMPNEYIKYSFENRNPYQLNYPKKDEIKIYEVDHRSGCKHIIFDKRRKAEILNELRNTIEKALLEVEKLGIEYGKNVLLQLNKGDITLKDFENEES